MDNELQILIHEAQNNKRKAQGELYKRFSPKLFAVCLRYSYSSEQAQDCLQEAFLVIFEKLYQYKGIGSFEGWMKKITLNICLAKLKSEKNIIALTDYSENTLTEDETETIDEELNQQKIEHILLVLKEMPPQYKTVFNLYVIEDLSHKEISEKLNISEGTSKSNYFRAKEWIKKHLKKWDNQGLIKSVLL